VRVTSLRSLSSLSSFMTRWCLRDGASLSAGVVVARKSYGSSNGSVRRRLMARKEFDEIFAAFTASAKREA
jgi:hypothetical protein